MSYGYKTDKRETLAGGKAAVPHCLSHSHEDRGNALITEGFLLARRLDAVFLNILGPYVEFFKVYGRSSKGRSDKGSWGSKGVVRDLGEKVMCKV